MVSRQEGKRPCAMLKEVFQNQRLGMTQKLTRGAVFLHLMTLAGGVKQISYPPILLMQTMFLGLAFHSMIHMNFSTYLMRKLEHATKINDNQEFIFNSLL